MPNRDTVRLWKNANPEFSGQYARAREDQADAYADLALEAATEAVDPAKGRLAFDAYRWAAGKLKPGRYGDKLQHANAAGDGDTKVEHIFRWQDGPDPTPD